MLKVGEGIDGNLVELADRFYEEFTKDHKGKELLLESKNIGLNFRQLICSLDLSDLNNLHINFKNTDFANKIKKYYEDFRKRVLVRKFYSESLKIKSCLFCNAQFSAKIKNEKLGFEYDHFLPKSKYPILSISLFNLVPVCSHCNKKKNDKEGIFYPYQDNMNDLTFFDLNEEKLIRYLTGNKEEDFIEWKLKDENFMDKFNTHREMFKIDKLYNSNFKDKIEELLNKQLIYNESRIEELSQFSFLDREMLERIHLSNYSLDKDINKRPLAKLVKDISTRLGLI